MNTLIDYIMSIHTDKSSLYYVDIDSSIGFLCICRIMAEVRVYMITQNNFYPNWTSELYTSDTVAVALAKNFYKGIDLENFLNTSRYDSTNAMLVEELCIRDLDVRVATVPIEDSTEWPESTTGIAVITVSAFLLLSFLFCLICCICVCCLREEKEKE